MVAAVGVNEGVKPQEAKVLEGGWVDPPPPPTRERSVSRGVYRRERQDPGDTW